MPITPEGKKIMANFSKRYGAKGENYAYASANKKGKGSKLYSLLHKG